MPDVSLPPVGELVQIIDQQGQVSLGYRHHEESKHWLERLGKPPIRLISFAGTAEAAVAAVRGAAIR